MARGGELWHTHVIASDGVRRGLVGAATEGARLLIA
jgi:hypothetical protein